MINWIRRWYNRRKYGRLPKPPPDTYALWRKEVLRAIAFSTKVASLHNNVVGMEVGSRIYIPKFKRPYDHVRRSAAAKAGWVTRRLNQSK